MIVLKKKETEPLGFGLKVRQSFAFLPIIIRQPKSGVLWLEFYGKVYQYINGTWHFIGILHRDFESAKFKDWADISHRVHWERPSTSRKFFYFLRWGLVILFWALIIWGLILLIHIKYH